MSKKNRPPASQNESISSVRKSGLQAKFMQALAQHQKGNFPRAETICKQVLKRQSNHFDALHLLGVIALQTKRSRRAVEFLRKAIAVDQDVAEPHSNLGNALRGLQRDDEAVVSYDRAISLKPEYAYLRYNRGIVLRELIPRSVDEDP